MLKYDTARGPHSTGVVYVPNHDRQHPKVIKNLDTPWHMMHAKPVEYYNNNEGKKDIQGDFCVMMGHNRWATVGKVTEENAHPFEAGNIIGSHNGTLSDYKLRNLDEWEYYETDSECLFHNIDVHGVENVIPKIDGAWALAWYNKGEDTFNILRNKERPLYYGWKKNGKVMYYASEAWMIYEACERFKIDLKDDSVYEFTPNYHYKYVIGNINSFSVGRLYETELKGYTAPPVTHHYPTYNRSNLHVVGGTTHTAASSANVFIQKAFGGNEEAATSKPGYWMARIGTFAEFTVDGTVLMDEQRKQYIAAFTQNGCVPIRIYASDRCPTALLGDVDISTFAGKIKKVKLCKSSKFYITLELDSIMAATFRSSRYRQLEQKDEIPWGDIFVGDNVSIIADGDIVTKEEYNQRVSCGCAWCSVVPPVEDCAKITWISKRDFLCADCSVNEEVMQFCTRAV